MAETEAKTIVYQITLPADQFTAGAQQIDSAANQVVGGLDRVVTSEEKLTQATRTTADGFSKLEATVSESVRAENQRAAAIQKATLYLEEGRVTQQRYSEFIDQVNAKYDQQVAAINRLRAATANNNSIVQTATGTTRNFGLVAQQAGFQIGDLAVQIASGQGVLRPLIQQGTQFLQVFGAWGSVLGAAAAVVGAVVVGLGLFSSKTEDASSKTQKLTNEQKELNKALEESNRLLVESQGFLDQYGKKFRENLIERTAEGVAASGALVKALREQYDEQLATVKANAPSGLDDQALADLPEMLIVRQTKAKLDQAEFSLRALSEQSIRLGKIGDTNASSSKAAGESESSMDKILAGHEREVELLKMANRERAIAKSVDTDLAQAGLTRVTAGAKLIDQLETAAAAEYDLAEANKASADATRKSTAETAQQKKQREDATRTLGEFIQNLEAQTEILKLSDREQAVQNELLKAENILRGTTLKLLPAQAKEIERLARLKYDEAKAEDARQKAEEKRRQEADKAVKEHQRDIEQQTQVIGNQIEMLVNAAAGWEDWRDVAKQAIRVVLGELQKLKGLGGEGGGLFSEDGLLGGLFNIALGAFSGGIGGSVAPSGLPYSRGAAGFAGGGDFTVGGSGGTDSKLIKFRASPGEMVSVRTPRQQQGGGAVHVTNVFDFRNSSMPREMIRSEIARATPQIVNASVNETQNRKQRGGSYTQTMRG